MQLIGMELTNYRKYGLAEIAFPDGLVGIMGPNGAGKSTLMEAIAWALYGNPAARTQKEEIKRQGASDREPCRVLLHLRFAGDEYLIARELKGKELVTDAVVSVNRNEVARGAQACSAYVANMLGLDREAFFTSFFARQKELNSLSELSPGARKDLIIHMLGIDAVDRAVDAARQKLRDIRTRLSTLRESIPDREALSRELKETRTNFVRAEKDYASLLVAKKDQEKVLERAKREFREQEAKRERHLLLAQELKLKRGELKLSEDVSRERLKEIGKLKEAQERLERIEPVVCEYEALRERLDELVGLQSKSQLLAELVKRKEELSKKQEEYESRARKLRERSRLLDHALEKAEATDKKLEQMEKEIERKRDQCSEEQSSLLAWQREEQKILSELKQMALLGKDKECPRCRRPLGKDFLEMKSHLERERAAVTSSQEESRSKFTQQNDELRILQEKRNLLKTKQKELEEKEHERRFLTREMEQTCSHLKETIQELSQVIEQIGDLGEIEYHPSVHQELKDRFKEVSQVRDRSLRIKASVQRLPELETQLCRLSDKIKALQKEIVSLKEQEESLSFSPAFYQESKKESEREQEQHHQIELSLRDNSHQCHLLELRVAALRKELENCIRSEQEVSQLIVEQQYLDKLGSIFQDFRKCLIGRIRPALAQKASDLLSELTDGKYSKMELNEDYEIFIFEQGERFSLERFSGGEKDLANLCLRLAISYLVSENAGSELGFIVLDEVFGSQDPQRKANIITALSRLNPRFRQIFLITHIDDVKDSMEHIITVHEGEDQISYAQLQ